MMLNEVVSHVKFGRGTVVKNQENHIVVAFDNSGEEKVFRYPDAFERFLAFQNQSLQQEAQAKLLEQKEAQAILLEQKRQQFELHEQERKREQRELLRRRRKALKERMERENRSGGKTA